MPIGQVKSSRSLRPCRLASVVGSLASATFCRSSGPSASQDRRLHTITRPWQVSLRSRFFLYSLRLVSSGPSRVSRVPQARPVPADGEEPPRTTTTPTLAPARPPLPREPRPPSLRSVVFWDCPIPQGGAPLIISFKLANPKQESGHQGIHHRFHALHQNLFFTRIECELQL